MRNYNYTLLKYFLLTAIAFLFISLLLQPGSVDLTTPTHSDLYRYFVVSQERWTSANWLVPRPLMLAYLKVSGIFGQENMLFLLISIPSLIFVSLVARLINNVDLVEKSLLPLIAFYLVVFGSPLFYPHFQLDYGGMLGGIFAVLAVQSGRSNIQGDPESPRFWWLPPLLFTILSVESKPNYSFALLILAFIAAVSIAGRRSKWLFFGVVLILIWVFFKDKFISSPFIAASGVDSPYAVIIDPWKNINALGFYLKSSFTLPLMIAVVAASITLLLEKRIRLLIILLVLTVAASLPMALIPNRLWDTYAWYSTVVLGVLIMIATAQVVKNINQASPLKKFPSIFLMAVMTFGLFAHALSHHPTVEWTMTNQQYNANVLSELKHIKNEGGSKLLLAGTRGPYHPLKNTKYVMMAYPELRNFDVLLRENERIWNQMSREQLNGVYPSNVDFNIYSHIYIFGVDGHLKNVLVPGELTKLRRVDLNLLLMCNKYDFNNPTDNARAIECLNANGEYESAIDLGRSAIKFGDIQPWIYFHLSKSYIENSENQKAKKLLLQALAKDPGNSLFQKTLTEIRE